MIHTVQPVRLTSRLLNKGIRKTRVCSILRYRSSYFSFGPYLYCFIRNSGLFKFEYFQFQNVLYGDAKDWARRIFDFLIPNVPRVMNPHNKLVQQWNKFFAICCLVAIFVDPLFFFLLYVNKVCLFLLCVDSNIAKHNSYYVFLQFHSNFSGFCLQVQKCIVINSTMTTVLVILRSVNDFIHSLNIILQV